MIILKLQGGLGNQLFQYSFARSLSLKYNQTLYIDISSYNSINENITPRKEELTSLGIKIKLLGKFYIKIIKLLIILKEQKLFPKLKIPFTSIIKENCFEFIDNIEIVKGINIIDGFWQSPLYFNNYEKIIFKDFILKKQVGEKSLSLINNLKNSNVVCIHVRRGDYLTNLNASSFHGVCEIEYYKRAIDYLENKLKINAYLFFSDDLNWVKSEFSFINKTKYYSDEYTNNDIEDFYLMTSFNHNIIANSSFSWWSAYLNPNPNKIVIAPLKWFKDSTINTIDLFPQDWVRL